MKRALVGWGVVAAVAWASGGAAFATVPVPPAVDTSKIESKRIDSLSLVDAERRGVVLASGGSATEFSLSLPGDASCPGDSRNDNWRVQTFIVPSDIDPASVEYGPNGPTGERQWAFYDTVTSPVIEGLLVPNDAAGSPARIDIFPPMSFRVFPVGEIPPGRYRAGAACTWFGATGPYWDTELVFADAPDDQPARLTWSVPGVDGENGTAPSADSSPPWTAIFVFVAVCAFGFAFFLGRQQGRPKRSIT